MVFLFGFCIEFNMVTGIGGGQAAAVGNYGYRLIDFASFGALGLIAFHSLLPGRILSLGFYALMVGVMFFPQVLSFDQQTAVLSYRYILYSFAALYLVVVINEGGALDWFCWGLIIGLLATLAVFAVQDSVYYSKLSDWGLMPRYAPRAFTGEGGIWRFAGLSGHPNEAGHVAALSAAAGAYFAIVRRKFLPIVIVAAGLIAVFYYTRSRAGFFAGGATISLSLLIAQGRVTFFRFTVMLIVVIISLVLLSQIDFVASRFTDDRLASSNITDRVGSTLYGLHLLLAQPFGTPIVVVMTTLVSYSGQSTPHNGLIFFGVVFGLVPLLILLWAFTSSVRVHAKTDIFFAFLTLQVVLSFFFEQLTGSCSYEFVICLLIGHAFLRTRIGRLMARSAGPISQYSFAPMHRRLG